VIWLRGFSLFAAMALNGPAAAQSPEEAQAYVEANLISIFYHELGHALIDVMALPVFGQEEDAADTASILLIDALFEEDTAQSIARDAAFGFLDEAAATEGEEPLWWDVHGPDLQRHYNLVCLFYGADPELRADIAVDLDLPQDRAETCAEEFELALASWGPVLDDITQKGGGASLVFEDAGPSPLQDVIATEVAALNDQLTLPYPVTIRAEPCGEANAFYDPADQTITMCLELESHLFERAAQNIE